MDTIAWLTITTVTASIVAVLNGITAFVVGVSKFRWSKVISEAKEAQIKGLEMEVQNLRELTPMRLQEYAKATASLLGDQIDGLEEQLRQEQEKRESLQTTVAESGIQKAIREHNELVQDLEDALKEAQQDRDAADSLSRPGGTVISNVTYADEAEAKAAALRSLTARFITRRQPEPLSGEEGESG